MSLLKVQIHSFVFRFFLFLILLLMASAINTIQAEEKISNKISQKRGVEKSVKPFGLQKRTPWKTSKVKGFPDPLPPYTLEIAFPDIKLNQPVALFPEPGTNRLIILELDGKFLALEDNHQAKQGDLIELGQFKPDSIPEPVKDEKADKKKTYKAGTRKTQGFTFHPEYEKNGFIFVTSEMTDPKLKTDKQHKFMRVTRYQVAKTSPAKVDMSSEKIIIEWDSNGHTGGDLDFGPDGFLYISCGDGSSDSDENVTGQDISDLQGSIIRIDVDQPVEGKSYSIPSDNPFVNSIGARPEVWSFGHRAPWRMSFDEKTGDLWLGDVGQDLWEMIHLIKKGANYGWSVREGNHPFRSERKHGPVPITPPIVEHNHSESRSITGGLVYYGARLKELYGYYIYCDYATGTVWGFQYQDNKVINHHVLARTNWQVPSFGMDHKGEIYSVALTGEMLHLVPQKQKDSSASFPRKISETGLFVSVPDQKLSPGVISYSVNTPSWNDGSTIQRYLGVPGDDKIEWKKDRGWDFSDGAVAVQTFSMQMDENDPGSSRKIETRILTKQAGEWFGYSYRWNQEQTDADLVPDHGESIKLSLKRNGHDLTQTWNIPSRSECMVCHSRAVNFVLGLSTVQLNGNHDYSGIIDNQIRTFNHIGLLKKPLKDPLPEYKHLVDPYDQKKDINDRARSYLHANCSHCHVKAGGGNAKIELEYTTPTGKMNLFDEVPVHSHFSLPDARVIASRDPFRSVLLYRMSKLGPGRMPHIGSSKVDVEGVNLIRDWIRQLPKSKLDNLNISGESLAIYRKAVGKHVGRLVKPRLGLNEVTGLLDSPGEAMMLLELMARNKIPTEVQDGLIAKANSHSNPYIRDLFENYVPEEKRMERLGVNFNKEEFLSIKGRLNAGSEIYLKMSGVLCRNCHQIQKQGKMLGPDLSIIGKKYDKTQLLENILYPSRKIEREYATYVVQTTEGKIKTGLLIKRNEKEIILKDIEHKMIVIPADEIEEIQEQKKSLMPDMLLKDLTPQQAADLIEYLSSLKK